MNLWLFISIVNKLLKELNKMSIKDTLKAFLNTHNTVKVYLACSGGVDSMVLLHALSSIADKSCLEIIHINHQLHKDSDNWAKFVKDTALEYGIGCQVITVNIVGSDENSARQARYQAIADNIPEHALVLTAHHLLDQQETFIFRAMRGTSLSGLVGMQPINILFGMQVGRPLLSIDKASILAYANDHQLKWVEDPSNQDNRYKRNLIRQLIPNIHNQSGFLTTQKHIARQTKLLNDSISHHLSMITSNSNVLHLSKLKTYTDDWQQELFHVFLTNHVGNISTIRSESLLNMFLTANSDKYPSTQFGDYSILKYRDDLIVLTLPQLDSIITTSHKQVVLSIGTIHNPTGQLLRVKPLGGHASKYKKYLQSVGIPSWLRAYIPVINCEGTTIELGKDFIYYQKAIETAYAHLQAISFQEKETDQ